MTWQACESSPSILVPARITTGSSDAHDDKATSVALVGYLSSDPRTSLSFFFPTLDLSNLLKEKDSSFFYIHHPSSFIHHPSSFILHSSFKLQTIYHAIHSIKSSVIDALPTSQLIPYSTRKCSTRTSVTDTSFLLRISSSQTFRHPHPSPLTP